MAFSPDGQRIASGSEDNTVKVWDAATGQETLTLKGTQGVVKRGLQPGRPADRLGQLGQDGEGLGRRTGQETLTLRDTRITLERGLQPGRPAGSSRAVRTTR